MTIQRSLVLTLARLPGESKSKVRSRNFDFQHPPQKATSPDKLFADLLKRQARRVMADVTECPPETLPAHLARLDGLREVFAFALRHELIPGNETLLSGKQLIFAATVADFAACLQITRDTHRAPAFINSRETELAQINHKLDVLAGLFAASPSLDSVLNEGGAL